MRIRIGVENNQQGRSLAWALDFPGAFAYGGDGGEAILNLPRKLIEYQEWANRHAGYPLIRIGDFDLHLEDTWDVYSIDEHYELSDDGYEVNAWFRDDWRPLAADEIERGLMLLRWSRHDLLAIAGELPDAKLDAEYENERWSIRGILNHIAAAEWWYMDRLGLAMDRSELPKEVFPRLALARSRLEQVLPTLDGSGQVLGVDGEFWSPRKLLRRALWHELDHIVHITHLL